jgi:cyanophycin synthetase
LRHPKLDLLIAEYPETIFTDSGMFYTGSNIVVLNDPTETEKIIAEDLLPSGTLIIKEDNQVNLQVKGLRESYQLDETVCFSYIYQKEINRLIDEIV